jgi:hypothetical protein
MRYFNCIKPTVIFAYLVCGMFFTYTHKASAQPYHTNWIVTDPFTHDVFIENKGQFGKQEQSDVGEKIMYATKKGKLHFYFTQTTIVFRYDSAYQIKNDDDNTSAGNLTESQEALKTIRTKHVYLTLNWEGANHDAYLEVKNQVPDYYTYGDPNDKSGQTSILAHAWRKLIYHNLYNGIDVEVFFPDKSKGGLEYNLIVHPGADISKIKMHWKGENTSVKMVNGDVHISSPCANFIDHAPTAKDEAGIPTGTSFSVQNNSVCFKTDKFDNTKVLTIDPWLTTTSLGGVNKAYDLDYDVSGNVYVYGGGS